MFDASESTEVRVLGVLDVLVDGVPVDVRAAKVGAVLAMLALHPGQVVSADRLSEGLWGEAPPPRAANTLQGYISQLRRTLGRESIVTRPPGYLLALPAQAVDARRFEGLVAEGRTALTADRPLDAADLLERALALWRGPALDDFAYDPFAQPEAARLEELRLVATEELFEARLALGMHQSLVGDLRAHVDRHPLRERLWSQLMRALYRCGRQAEALRAFSELRRRLGEELGIEPSPALQRLEDEMLLQNPDLEWLGQPVGAAPPVGPATTRHNLPAPRSSFVGRDEELRELEKLIATGAVVTVAGPGGSGKSRLALEVARRLVADYPGGVWLVELASVAEPELVPQAVAAAVGVREEPGRALTESMAAALDHGALLVLDNCEHLVDASAALADALVRAAPALTVLATSREPLRVDGEVLWRIPTLAAPETDSTPGEELLTYDAVRLFVDRAVSQGNYEWGPDNAPTVARICRRLDGLPLAIELAAARTGALTPGVIADRLDNRFAVLTGGFRTALARHQTLRATVDWSYELLRPAERVLFRRLSIFAGGCSVSAAEAVCAGDGLGAAEVLNLLTALVDRSLVIVTEQGGESRFGMHETLRAYAAERLAAAGEERALQARHVLWTLRLAESERAALAPQLVTKRAALDRVERDHDNIRQALRWCLGTDPDAALRLVASIGPFWSMRGHLGEGRRWSEEVLAATPEGDVRMRAKVLDQAGGLAIKQGDAARGQELIEQSIVAYRGVGEMAAVALAMEQLIWPAFDAGDWGRAEDLARQCVDIQSQVGDEHLASESMMVLAEVRARVGDERSALELMDEALSFNLRHAEDPCPMLRARSGHIALLLGDFGPARERLEEAVRYSREAGQLFHLSGELGWLGEVAYLDGTMEEAEGLFTQQLSASKEQGAWVWTRHALLWLAKVAVRRGDVVGARHLVEELQSMSRTGVVRDPEELEAIVELLAAEGRCPDAAHLLGTAEALREALGEPVPRAYSPALERVVSNVIAAIGPEPFATARAEGRRAMAATGPPPVSLQPR